MEKRYLSTEFGINLHDGFWENGFYGRRTTDGRRIFKKNSKIQTSTFCGLLNGDLK